MGQHPMQINNPPINFNPVEDEFQSIYLQRIKETPFINSQPYLLNPPIHIDPIGIPLLQLTIPRFNSRQLFPENEVYRMLSGLVTALMDLEDRGYEGHGDVSTNSVYYCKHTKLFKLKHPKLCESGYLLAKQGKRFTTLSPQQLLALTNNSNNQEISFLSDIFSLGILMCQVATLTPSAEIYCPETYKIFDEEIQNRLKLISEYYSPKLTNIIAAMITYNRQERPKIKDILSLLNTQLKNTQKINMQTIKTGREADQPNYPFRN